MLPPKKVEKSHATNSMNITCSAEHEMAKMMKKPRRCRERTRGSRVEDLRQHRRKHRPPFRSFRDRLDSSPSSSSSSSSWFLLFHKIVVVQDWSSAVAKWTPPGSCQCAFISVFDPEWFVTAAAAKRKKRERLNSKSRHTRRYGSDQENSSWWVIVFILRFESSTELVLF